MPPLIFAQHEGWKRNASPLPQRAPLACASILETYILVRCDRSFHRRWMYSRRLANRDNRLQVCDSFHHHPMWEGALVSECRLHPLARPPNKLHRDNHFLRSTPGFHPTTAEQNPPGLKLTSWVPPGLSALGTGLCFFSISLPRCILAVSLTVASLRRRSVDCCPESGMSGLSGRVHSS